jgi:hypothetical protein
MEPGRFREEARMPGRGWSGALCYGLPGLFLGLALASGGRGGGREVWAQASVPAGVGLDHARGAASGPGGQADGTIALVTNPGGPVQLLYLIDTRSRAFTIYRVDSTKGNVTVKLDAARQYGWDLRLTNYNNLEPQPAAVESAVKSTTGEVTRSLGTTTTK